jgi:hypothetical protein
VGQGLLIVTMQVGQLPLPSADTGASHRWLVLPCREYIHRLQFLIAGGLPGSLQFAVRRRATEGCPAVLAPLKRSSHVALDQPDDAAVAVQLGPIPAAVQNSASGPPSDPHAWVSAVLQACMRVKDGDQAAHSFSCSIALLLAALV